MNVRPIFWILAFVLLFSVVGCQKQDAETVSVADAAHPEGERGGGLDVTTKLVLGTLRLEGTNDAVTPEQAAELLPLWQIIQSGSLKSTTETNAVLKQIEGKMSDAQIATIETMTLTMEDMQTWMQEQGITLPERAMPEGQKGSGGPGRQGGPGALGDLSEDERAQMREQFQSVSAEERATRMAELGVSGPEGDPGSAPNPGMPGGGSSNLMLAPLIELLAERAAQ